MTCEQCNAEVSLLIRDDKPRWICAKCAADVATSTTPTRLTITSSPDPAQSD